MSFLIVILEVLVVLCSIFLICLVLIQRGKGGGLAGAFGGAGGSSAFGTKAGDVFTRVTIIAAGVWIGLNMLLVILSNRGTTSALGTISDADRSRQVAPTVPGGPSGADAPTAPLPLPTGPSPTGSSGPVPALPTGPAPVFPTGPAPAPK